MFLRNLIFEVYSDTFYLLRIECAKESPREFKAISDLLLALLSDLQLKVLKGILQVSILFQDRYWTNTCIINHSTFRDILLSFGLQLLLEYSLLFQFLLFAMFLELFIELPLLFFELLLLRSFPFFLFYL
jgi:hypothetical protein